MLIAPKHSVLRPAGVSIINSPELPFEQQADYKQCVHCQSVWKVEPGSGRLRGFCMKCNGPICGPGCAECKGSFEKMLDDILAGRDPGSRLVSQVNFGGNE